MYGIQQFDFYIHVFAACILGLYIDSQQNDKDVGFGAMFVVVLFVGAASLFSIDACNDWMELFDRFRA